MDAIFGSESVIDYGQYNHYCPGYTNPYVTSDTVVEEYEYYPNGTLKRKKVTRLPVRQVQPWAPFQVTC